MTFDEVMREPDLRRIGTHETDSKTWWTYECPCGGKDHAAHRPIVEDGESEFPGVNLYCFKTNQVWWVRSADAVAG